MYTRRQIVEAAEKFLGLRFVHQGRSAETGIDCVGLLVLIGREIGYPEIHDVEGYRRIPRPEVIRDVLARNCDEIAISDAREGDFYFMRYGGRIPRHAAVIHSMHPEQKLIHASNDGVRIEPMSNFPSNWIVGAYRVRELMD
jgi:cell wall-associated NlpC family hydrolase